MRKITLFKLTFNPLHAMQGALVFAAFLFVAFSATNIFFPKHKIQTANLIKSVVTKQTTAAVAGKTSQNIQWTALIKKSNLNNNNFKLQLPKNAENIKIKTISHKDANNIISQSTPTANLAMEDRKTLALQSSKTKSKRKRKPIDIGSRTRVC